MQLAEALPCEWCWFRHKLRLRPCGIPFSPDPETYRVSRYLVKARRSCPRGCFRGKGQSAGRTCCRDSVREENSNERLWLRSRCVVSIDFQNRETGDVPRHTFPGRLFDDDCADQCAQTCKCAKQEATVDGLVCPSANEFRGKSRPD